MTATNLNLPPRIWSATELRQLPPDQRDAVLASAATCAESEYRSNPALTDFEAFGKEDLRGDSSDTQSR
jgi:hypothetical protein